MWPFEKKPKIYCEECKHYHYKHPDHSTKYDKPFQCFAEEGKKIKHWKSDSPLSKGFIETETIKYVDAWAKNRYNDCKDFEAKWFDLEKINNETS